MRSLTSFGKTFVAKRKGEGRRNFALQNFFFPPLSLSLNLVILCLQKKITLGMFNQSQKRERNKTKRRLLIKKIVRNVSPLSFLCYKSGQFFRYRTCM